MKTVTNAFLFALIAMAWSPIHDLAFAPLDTAFTYQGVLKQNGQPVDGTFDLEFRLFDSLAGGSALQTELLPDTAIADGLVNADIDWGANAFTGSPRYLEIVIDGTVL